MPTYQYVCTEATCGHRFEAIQAFTDPALSVCPVCSGRVRKVFSSVGIVFKGSGFYRTDSRDSHNGHSLPAGEGAKKDAEKGADGAQSSTDSGSSGSSSDSGSSSKASADSSSSSSSSSSSTSKAAAS